MPICIEIGSFVVVIELWHSQVGNDRRKGHTDGRTDEGMVQVENIVSLAARLACMAHG